MEVIPVFKNGKWAAVDSNLISVIPYLYDYLETVNKKYLIAKKNEKYGLLDYSGKIVLPFSYENISNHLDKFLRVKESGAYGILDYSGRRIIESQYSSIKIEDSNIAILTRNGNYFYYTFKKQEVSEQYDSIIYKKNDFYILFKNDKRCLYNLKDGYKSDYYSLISKKHSNIFFCMDDDGDYIIDGYQNYKLVKTNYLKFIRLNSNLYAYQLNDKLQLTDEKKGISKLINAQSISQPFRIYESRISRPTMADFVSVSTPATKDSFLYIKNKGKTGVINDNFEQIIPPIYDRIHDYNLNFTVWKDGKIGKLSPNGQILFPAIYNDFRIDGNYYIVSTDEGSGIFDLDYNVIIFPKYESISPVAMDLFLFTKNFRKGIINSNNRILIPARYNSIIIESNGFIVGNDKKYGLINMIGNVVLKPKYDDISKLNERYFTFAHNKKMGLLNTNGQIIQKPKYDRIRKLNERYFIIENEKKMGLLNANGQVVVEPKFNTITATANENIFYVSSGSYEQTTRTELINRFNLDIPIPQAQYDTPLKRYKVGLINTFGQILLEPKYFHIQISDDLEGNIITVKEKTFVLVISVEDNGRLIEKVKYKNYIAVKKGRVIKRRNHWRRGGEDDLCGLFSARGSKLIDYKYTGLERNFLNDSDLVKTRIGRKHFGIVNQKKGKVLLPAYFRSIHTEDFDIAPVARCFSKTRVRLINSKGITVGKGFGYIDDFKDNYIRVNKGGRTKKSCDFIHQINVNKNHKYLNTWCDPEDPKLDACQKGKWGVFDTTASYIIKPKYDFLQKYFRGVFIAELNSMWGVISPDDHVIVDFKYDEIRHFNNDSLKYLWEPIPYFKVRLKNKWGVIDSVGNKVVKIAFDDVEYIGNKNNVHFKTIIDYKNTLYGVINRSGKIVLQPKYEQIGEFKNGFARVKLKRRCWNFIDSNMRQLSEDCYVKVRDFSENAAAVKTSKGWGLIDGAGRFIITAKYYDVGDFSEGFTKVKMYKPAKLFGLIKSYRYYVLMNKQGKIVLKTKSSLCSDVKNNNLTIFNNWKYQLITTKGKKVLPSKYKQITEYPEYRLYIVKDENNQTAIYNHNAELLVPFGKYKKINKFSDGLSYVEGNETGFIDTNGIMKFKVKYKKVKSFHEGMAAVEGKGKWGYINTRGQLVIPLWYNDAGNFQNGIARVLNRYNNVLYINKEANVLYKIQNRAGQDLFYVKSGKFVGIATKDNNFLALPAANHFKKFSENFAAFGMRKLYGIYNSKGKQLAKAKYSFVEKVYPDLIKLTNVEEIKYVK